MGLIEELLAGAAGYTVSELSRDCRKYLRNFITN